MSPSRWRILHQRWFEPPLNVEEEEEEYVTSLAEDFRFHFSPDGRVFFDMFIFKQMKWFRRCFVLYVVDFSIYVNIRLRLCI